MISKDLNLYEEVLLLALRDQEGTFFSSTMFSYALVAIMAGITAAITTAA